MSERCNIIESNCQILGAWNLGYGLFALPPAAEERNRPDLQNMSLRELVSMSYDQRGFLVSHRGQ